MAAVADFPSAWLCPSGFMFAALILVSRSTDCLFSSPTSTLSPVSIGSGVLEPRLRVVFRGLSGGEAGRDCGFGVVGDPSCGTIGGTA